MKFNVNESIKKNEMFMDLYKNRIEIHTQNILKNDSAFVNKVLVICEIVDPNKKCAYAYPTYWQANAKGKINFKDLKKMMFKGFVSLKNHPETEQ